MKPRTPPFVSPVTVERRSVLGWLGTSSVFALGGDFLASCLGGSQTHGGARDAGSSRSDGGASEAGTSPDFPFQPGSGDAAIYDDWYVNSVDPQNLPQILAGWTLTVDGMVKSPLVFGFGDLIALQRQDQVTDFHCVEGWSVLDVPWNGVSLAHVLDLVGADAEAKYLTFHSSGGLYRESLPISVAREPKTLLGYGVGGSTLPLDHGFPVRLVVPRLLGYKNAKYLMRIEATDHPETGYWESYGYSYDGEVPPERLRPGKY